MSATSSRMNVGCFDSHVEDLTAFAVPSAASWPSGSSSQVTVGSCVDACGQSDYSIALVAPSMESRSTLAFTCHCANSAASLTVVEPQYCNRVCTSAEGRPCGGLQNHQVYISAYRTTLSHQAARLNAISPPPTDPQGQRERWYDSPTGASAPEPSPSDAPYTNPRQRWFTSNFAYPADGTDPKIQRERWYNSPTGSSAPEPSPSDVPYTNPRQRWFTSNTAPPVDGTKSPDAFIRQQWSQQLRKESQTNNQMYRNNIFSNSVSRPPAQSVSDPTVAPTPAAAANSGLSSTAVGIGAAVASVVILVGLVSYYKLRRSSSSERKKSSKKPVPAEAVECSRV
ncbi:uncharacterized protein BJ171DRAFT_505832 [Polychytrium aggregatum]|uniref:uncharacterized protein n=1 Tax=Polychytrium aggregatum TaxID=110093 RepID=UPI0022FEAA8A|nr:uncharacterized protein BJ171DRAFT_505832 [Polychytrium aggregatum]KAI9204438.1 hypothetical protein BJ171DRAFT_505832 [Polychytrium aggregatum]